MLRMYWLNRKENLARGLHQPGARMGEVTDYVPGSQGKLRRSFSPLVPSTKSESYVVGKLGTGGAFEEDYFVIQP